MGCTCSNDGVDANNSYSETGYERPVSQRSMNSMSSGGSSSSIVIPVMSATETKLSKALLKKKVENSFLEKPLTLEKILLKFDKLRGVIGHVKTIFEQVSVNGKLNNAGLEAVMKRLNVRMTMEDILDLFDFVNIQEHDDITMKEFLVALTIGMVLEVIPAFTDTTFSSSPVAPTKTSAGPAPIQRSFSVLLGHNPYEIKEMLNLIVSAYLIFDVDAKGYISRDVIENMIEEGGHKQGKNAILSAQRWDEMDWDGNGTIDFAEFLYSFTSWVDIDDDGDDGDDDETDDK